MDFDTLLSVAQKNEQRPAAKAYYQTKFAPPKKESKQSKVLSNNIKKFLARKEEEERQKNVEEQRKKEHLLALRDQKTQNRINKHLKVCKAANKAAIADAVDHENTAVTLAGPAQCDEDDYGYVSQEASAYYNKLMSKYNSLPPEKPLFSKDGKKTVKDIASTKDRVKQALKQQELEESLPHRRKRKHKDLEQEKNVRESEDSNDYKDKDKSKDKEKDYDKDRDTEREEKPKIKKKFIPPPMDFTALLKLAEKKQYEPIKIEPKPKPKEEPERLMTKRQMKEYAKEKEWREKKEQRMREQQNPKSLENSSADSGKFLKTTLTQSVTSNGHKISSDIEKTATKTLPSISKKSADKITERSYSTNKPVNKSNGEHRLPERGQNLSKTVDRINTANRSIEKSNGVNKNSLSKASTAEKDAIAEERRILEEEKRKLEKLRRTIEEEKKKLMISKNKKIDDRQPGNWTIQKTSGTKIRDSINQNSNLKNTSSKPIPPNNVKSRPFPPSDIKPRQFPPPDVRSSKSKAGSSKLKVNKRRIYDEDDEEYDSELDDFIDDGPEDESADYSKYISEIFGYDKNKYRHLDDEDDTAMESNFAQQLREEFVSTKIGIMEDLEDIRQEALEKKKKKEFMKKKMKR
ncbi:protein SPT2 homolog [Phymastichus coffea]|uniref:protein SPT2 homolog n=1 Tax=Phymastichus coffea TaxID=108790 RepID=UPI00273B3FF8|nr:protein SPT2 homolog [Phymastichus coffea]XP_058789198.1 protein SPT2 homolog [Phymastichus coffea]